MESNERINGQSNVCAVQLIHGPMTEDLMLMLGLNETIDQFAVANCVHWYGGMLRREDGYVLRRAVEFEAEGQRKNGG